MGSQTWLAKLSISFSFIAKSGSHYPIKSGSHQVLKPCSHLVITIIKIKNDVCMDVCMYVCMYVTRPFRLAGYCSETVGATATKFWRVIGRVHPFVVLKC